MAAKAAIHDDHQRMFARKQEEPAALAFLNFERRSCGPPPWMAAFAATTEPWGYVSQVLLVDMIRVARAATPRTAAYYFFFGSIGPRLAGAGSCVTAPRKRAPMKLPRRHMDWHSTRVRSSGMSSEK